MSDTDFNTWPEFLDVVRRLPPNGRIGLDPCSNATSLVDAVTSYTAIENGLAQSWRGHGLVFMNPPHGRSPHNIEPWLEKAHREFLDPRWKHRAEDAEDEFLALIPSKTDTAWFHDHARQFPGICFVRGRYAFWQHGVKTEGNGKFAHLVLYVGPRLDRFKHLFRPMGWVL